MTAMTQHQVNIECKTAGKTECKQNKCKTAGKTNVTHRNETCTLR